MNQLINKELLGGSQKVVIGDKYNDLVLKTLGRVYIQTGSKLTLLDELIKQVEKATSDKSKEDSIVILNNSSELGVIKYPGDGRFVFIKDSLNLYITFLNNYFPIIAKNEADINWDVLLREFVKISGSTMTGTLIAPNVEVSSLVSVGTTNKPPFKILSKKLVENLNTELISGYSEKELAKINVDEKINGRWTFNNDAAFDKSLVSASGYKSGFGGFGWKLDSATNTLTVDNLVVRKIMHVYELVVNKISATNGSLWVSDSAKVEEAIMLSIGPDKSPEDESYVPFEPDGVGVSEIGGLDEGEHDINVWVGNYGPDLYLLYYGYDEKGERVSPEEIREGDEFMYKDTVKKALFTETKETVDDNGNKLSVDYYKNFYVNLYLHWFNGNFYKIILDDDNAKACPFRVNDILRCLKFTGKSIKYYDCIVTNIKHSTSSYEEGNGYMIVRLRKPSIDLPDDELLLSGPEKGDGIVRVGNTINLNRQGAIYLTSSEIDSPYMDMIQHQFRPDYNVPFLTCPTDNKEYPYNEVIKRNVSNLRLGKLDGIYDPIFGSDQPNGMGLYAENVFLKGRIVVKLGDSEGPVAVFRGPWLPGVNYYENNQVTYEGELYNCTKSNIGKNPSSSTDYWLKIVEKGTSGESAYFLDLTNDNTSVIANEDGEVIDYTLAKTDVLMFHGTSQIAVGNVTVNHEYGENVTVEIDGANIQVTKLPKDTDAFLFTVIATGQGATVRGVFSISKIKNGKDSVINLLKCDPGVIYKDLDGNLDCTKISVSVYEYKNQEFGLSENKDISIKYAFDDKQSEETIKLNKAEITIDKSVKKITIQLLINDTLCDEETILVLEDGKTPSFNVYYFKQSQERPDTPTAKNTNDLDKEEWKDYPENTGYSSPWWMTTAKVQPTNIPDGGNIVIEGWSFPVKSTGEDGVNGEYYDFKYSTSEVINKDTINPGDNWEDSPPKLNKGDNLYMTKALVVFKDNVLSFSENGAQKWSDPVKINGEDGQQGDAGSDGPTLNYLLDYDFNKDYYIDASVRSAVRVKDGGEGYNYYMTKLPSELTVGMPTNGLIPKDVDKFNFAPGSDNFNNYWKPFSGLFSSIATGLLLAEEATIELLNTNEILIPKSSERTITAAGMSGKGEGGKGIRFWAGADKDVPRDKAPFRVDETGRVVMTNADITGKITATEFSFVEGEVMNLTAKLLKTDSIGKTRIEAHADNLRMIKGDELDGSNDEERLLINGDEVNDLNINNILGSYKEYDILSKDVTKYYYMQNNPLNITNELITGDLTNEIQIDLSNSDEYFLELPMITHSFKYEMRGGYGSNSNYIKVPHSIPVEFNNYGSAQPHICIFDCDKNKVIYEFKWDYENGRLMTVNNNMTSTEYTSRIDEGKKIILSNKINEFKGLTRFKLMFKSVIQLYKLDVTDSLIYGLSYSLLYPSVKKIRLLSTSNLTKIFSNGFIFKSSPSDYFSVVSSDNLPLIQSMSGYSGFRFNNNGLHVCKNLEWIDVFDLLKKIKSISSDQLNNLIENSYEEVIDKSLISTLEEKPVLNVNDLPNFKILSYTELIEGDYPEGTVYYDLNKNLKVK